MSGVGLRSPEAGSRHSAYEEHLAPAWKDMFETLDIEGASMLDVGCGTGECARLARDRGAHVWGIDDSEELIAIARDKLPDIHFFAIADFASLPYIDGSFDLVTLTLPLQHDNCIEETLRELHRIVRKEGSIGVIAWDIPAECKRTIVTQKVEGATQIQPKNPVALSAPGKLEVALCVAGIEVQTAGRVELALSFESVDAAVEAFVFNEYSHVTDPRQRQAVRNVLESELQTLQENGKVTIHNTVKWCRGVPH